MYAIKLELKLNNKERTLMARHSGYARFCYNYALNLYQEVKSLTGVSQKYAHIRIEDLNVSGMIANHKLAAAISDCGFYEFRRQLEYKSEMYGTKVK